MTLAESKNRVLIYDDIPVGEAEAVIYEVVKYFESIKNIYTPSYAKLEHLKSISKDFTPGIPEGIHLKCKYALNFYSAPMVYSLCIGLAESDGPGKMNKYYIYDSMDGIT